MNNSLYYECHITIEPILDAQQLFNLSALVSKYKFKVADLLMKKRGHNTLERSEYDTFVSSRDIDKEVLRNRMLDLLEELKLLNYKVWRYKIESVILDSKFDDKYGIIHD